MLTTWLVMAHNMLTTSFVECWKHHGSQHGKSVHNMEKEIATYFTTTTYFAK
jgi:hypothetical protein